MYFGNLYGSYIKTHELNIYGTKLQKLPTPQYIVFYNGTEKSEAVVELKLSDAFLNESRGGFEWTAVVYNLNKGKNDELLSRCKPLSEYMELINRIRDNQKAGMDIRDAVNAAVDSCIADGIMAEFLIKHKSEVISVCLTEFDEQVFVKGIREEGFEEGISHGMLKAYTDLLNDGMITIQEAAKRLNMSEAELRGYCEGGQNI